MAANKPAVAVWHKAASASSAPLVESAESDGLNSLRNLQARYLQKAAWVERFASDAGFYYRQAAAALLPLLCCLLVFCSFGRAQEALPASVVEALSPLYARAAITFSDSGFLGAPHDEYSFIYNTSGGVSPIHSDHDFNRNRMVIYGNTAGIVHTHPGGTSPHPSSADRDIARKVKIPNYVLSRRELWVALPDGTAHRVAFIRIEKGIVVLRSTP